MIIWKKDKKLWQIYFVNLNCNKYNLNLIINNNKDKDIIFSRDVTAELGDDGIINTGVMI